MDFSREWRGALDEPHSIEYFKMAEAANLSAKGQFARRLGWTEAKRDAKLDMLTRIIVRHAARSIRWPLSNTPGASPSLNARRLSTSLTPSLFNTSSLGRRRSSSPIKFFRPATLSR